MEYTDFKFAIPYINCSNFKEKDTLVLRNIIKGARIGDMLKFASYGNITFSEEDVPHWNPVITELDSFTRSKTNCMIFDIDSNCQYNKMFLYHTILPQHGFYGLLLYNSNINKFLHIYNIGYDINNLVIKMFKIINK